MKINTTRRVLLALAGGAVASSAIALRAQPRRRVRSVGLLMGLDDDAESQARIRAFEQAFTKEGWTLGQDLQIDYRFAAGDSGRMRSLARELVGLRPAVIVGHSTPVVTELVQATRTIPIVFVVVADPVGSGFAASISRPGGNATGFTNLDATITGKLLTMLKQITPNLSRVALMFNPDTVARGALFEDYLRSFDAAGSAFAVQASATEVHSPAEIEQRMNELAHSPGSGLIVMPDNFTTVHRDLIVALAARWRIPTIYPYRYFVDAGGLISYGVDVIDLFRRAPEYVSRILNGANPGDLPIQAPTKFELVINLKAARALDLALPRILLAGADSLID